MKLAVIDLDGVVANREVAFAHAEEVKQAYLNEVRLTGNIIRGEETNRYWRAVFDPEWVPTDTLIDGVNEALLDLQGVVVAGKTPAHIRAAIGMLGRMAVVAAAQGHQLRAPRGRSRGR